MVYEVRGPLGHAAPAAARAQRPPLAAIGDAGRHDVGEKLDRLSGRASGATCGGTPYPAVPVLTMNASVRSAARAHSVDMAANSYFSLVVGRAAAKSAGTGRRAPRPGMGTFVMPASSAFRRTSGRCRMTVT